MNRILFLALILISSIPCAADRPITTPKAQFGFNLGDDYSLANYKQLAEYWRKLDRESDRVKVVEIGTTEEGRTMLMAILTSPRNHRRLDHYRGIARRLALAEGVTEQEARKLSKDGKAVVWIDGGLHASETLGAQQLMETVYQFVSGVDSETRRILDDVIILAVLANPDGMDLVSDWYMREKDPKKRSLANLPRLYQKYIGHDNNRDFYASTQKETKAMNRVMYREWFPQIVYNHHQSGPQGTVLFMPPFRDPFNYFLDPLVPAGIDLVAASMENRFLVEDKPGFTTRSGASYSTWWNGGLRTTAYFHNMIGLLTETVGSPTPMRIPFIPQRQLPKQDLLAPAVSGEWRFRQSLDYSVTANEAVLDAASRHREQLLYNVYRMGRNSIERGSRDHWTMTPKKLAAIQAESGSTPLSERLRKLAWRDPRGYILPSDQPDFPTAVKFANALVETGITVHRATAPFEVQGRRYPSGSLVVKCAQAFRPHILDMFEPQDHPNDFAYPGGPPIPPYDIAGWTLALQMGVKFDRILDEFNGPFSPLTSSLEPPTGIVTSESAPSHLLRHESNNAYIAVNRLLKSGAEISRLSASLEFGGSTYPPGAFHITANATSSTLIDQSAKGLGLTFTGLPIRPIGPIRAIRPTKIALWDRFGGSMTSGWTRWILEQFEFPFDVLYPPDLDSGRLSAYDLLILPDGAIPALRTARASSTDSGDTPAAAPIAESTIPEEYRVRRGAISESTTLPRLRQFLESGGTILAIGSSTRLAEWLNLPVGSALVEKLSDGADRPLPREKFYIPGSLLSAKVDTSHPLAFGMDERATTMFVNSPAFRFKPGSDSESPTTQRPTDSTTQFSRIAWFDSEDPLVSGWAWGQKALKNAAAVIEAPVGRGRIILYGPEVLFRAQSHNTFKLIFNALYRTAE